MPHFNAIIVGAGPSGLLVALALQKAGIDFIILEKRKTADLNWGSSICLWPHSMRLLDQLGLLKEAEATYLPISGKCSLREDGSIISHSSMLVDVGKNHGHKWMFFERGSLVKMLMNHVVDLPNRLMVEKQVTDITSGDNGIEVFCKDGSVYKSSILIGADGINSSTRSFVDDVPTDQKNDSYAEGSFTTTYCTIYGHGYSLDPSLKHGVAYETHRSGVNGQLLVTSPERYFFLIYKRLPQTTRQRQYVGAQDAEDIVAQCADMYMAPGVTLRQVWEGRKWTHMAPLEEGITKTWFRERVVLLGDAVHRMTPNMGFSVNTAWQSTVMLTNRLRALLADNASPSTRDLAALFEQYERFCKDDAKKYLDVSATVTRVAAWDTWLWRMLDNYIFPRIGGDDLLLGYLVSPLLRNGLVFDFLPEPNFCEGQIKWANRPLVI